MHGLFGLFATLLIAGVAGVIGERLGLGNGITAAAAAGDGHVIYAPGFGLRAMAFGFFGLFFGLLILFLIFGAIRHAGQRGTRPAAGVGVAMRPRRPAGGLSGLRRSR